MKNNEKNGFLVVWGSSIIFLLLVCFFGVNDSVKGTQAATCLKYSCSSGYLVGSECKIDSVETICIPGESHSQTCTGTGCCPAGWSESCEYVPSSSNHICSCSYTSRERCYDNTTTTTVPATCVETSGSGGSGGSGSGEVLGGCYKPGTCPSGYKWIQVADFAGTNEVCGNCVPNASEAECPSFINSADCDCTAYVNSDMKTCYNCTCFDSCPDGFHREGNLCIQDECDCDESDPDCKPEEKPATPVTPSPNPGTSSNPSTSSNPNKHTTTPSSSSNIIENPQTGEIAIFVVWVVAIVAIVYSVYYFKKVNES